MCLSKCAIITLVAETVLRRLAGAQFCGKGDAPSRDVGLPQTSAVNAAAELSALLSQGLSSSITLLACQLSQGSLLQSSLCRRSSSSSTIGRQSMDPLGEITLTLFYLRERFDESDSLWIELRMGEFEQWLEQEEAEHLLANLEHQVNVANGIPRDIFIGDTGCTVGLAGAQRLIGHLRTQLCSRTTTPGRAVELRRHNSEAASTTYT